MVIGAFAYLSFIGKIGEYRLAVAAFMVIVVSWLYGQSGFAGFGVAAFQTIAAGAIIQSITMVSFDFRQVKSVLTLYRLCCCSNWDLKLQRLCTPSLIQLLRFLVLQQVITQLPLLQNLPQLLKRLFISLCVINF
jgi:hypothetical protein